jgi:hypothetical protein|tara:strand:- start:150 stop:1238 length:1089 start_codon:yes stop_codon:yes gene_type:complete
MNKISKTLVLGLFSTLAFAQSETNVPLYSSGYLALPGTTSELALAGSANPHGYNHQVFSLGILDLNNQLGISSIPSISGSHGPTSSLNRVGANYKLNESTALTASLGYFTAGDVELRDNDGNILGQFTPYETDLRIGVVKKLAKDFNLGVRLGYLTTNLGSSINTASITESSLLVDFSLDYTIKETEKSVLRTYWSLNNIGKKNNFDDDNLNYLPAQMALGIVFEHQISENLSVVPQLQLQKFLVPTPPNYNADGTIFSGQEQNTNIMASLFTSFNDAPEGSSEEVKEWCPIISSQLIVKEKILIAIGASLENQQKGNRQFVSLGLGYRTDKIILNTAYLIPISDAAGYFQGSFGAGLQYFL